MIQNVLLVRVELTMVDTKTADYNLVSQITIMISPMVADTINIELLSDFYLFSWGWKNTDIWGVELVLPDGGCNVTMKGVLNNTH